MDENHDANDSDLDDFVLTKPKADKQKRPKTAKQMEAFNKMQTKRQQDLAKIKKEKTITKLQSLLQEDEAKTKATIKPVKQVVRESQKSDSEDEEIIVIKKQKKPKKKTIIIEESSDEEEPEVKPKKDRFRSQQNKKSLITIHNKDNVNSNENASRIFI